jgi:hypothetical protein
MQRDLINPEEIWRETILKKLRGRVSPSVEYNLDRCGRETITRTCRQCESDETFKYRCNLKFCPLCNWRIARRRAELLKHWTRRITQPKHLVLTRKNFEVLTRSKIRESHRAVAALRRSKVWREVSGGCMSTEITHEGHGWHLHHHFLINVRWLDMAEVAKQWGKRLGQEFAIVKIKDARGLEYLGELTKYVVKPSELAGWDDELVVQFVNAIRGIRFFATFGELFKLAREIRIEINSEAPPPKICDCGCSDFVWLDETAAVLRQIRKEQRRR